MSQCQVERKNIFSSLDSEKKPFHCTNTINELFYLNSGPLIPIQIKCLLFYAEKY